MSTEDDELLDPIEIVRALAPAGEPSDDLLARVRSDLMATIDQTTTAATAPDDHVIHLGGFARPKRRWLVPVAAAAVLATAGAGWAITRSTTSPTASLSCPASLEGDVSVIRATTGDPVTDCTADWESNRDDAVPAMVAYRLGDGAISVVVDGQPAPAGGTLLAPGEGIDTRVVALSEAIDHHGSDLRTGCLDEAAARAAVGTEIERAGLDGWNIAVDPDRPIDADHPCARPIVQADRSQVLLLGGVDATGFAADVDPYLSFALDLDAELASNCANLTEAAEVVVQVAAATDVSALTDATFSVEAGTIQLRSVEESGADCSRATVEVGGSIMVTLRGPAA